MYSDKKKRREPRFSPEARRSSSRVAREKRGGRHCKTRSRARARERSFRGKVKVHCCEERVSFPSSLTLLFFSSARLYPHRSTIDFHVSPKSKRKRERERERQRENRVVRTGDHIRKKNGERSGSSQANNIYLSCGNERTARVTFLLFDVRAHTGWLLYSRSQAIYESKGAELSKKKEAKRLTLDRDRITRARALRSWPACTNFVAVFSLPSCVPPFVIILPKRELRADSALSRRRRRQRRRYDDDEERKRRWRRERGINSENKTYCL